jgi:hypothetical protein
MEACCPVIVSDRSCAIQLESGSCEVLRGRPNIGGLAVKAASTTRVVSRTTIVKTKTIENEHDTKSGFSTMGVVLRFFQLMIPSNGANGTVDVATTTGFTLLARRILSKPRNIQRT